MTIYDISIQNFQGIRSLHHLPASSLNTFVGENDAGKSSIIYAINAFLTKKATNLDVCNYCTEGESLSITLRFNPPEGFNWSALDSEGKFNVTRTFTFDTNGKLKVLEQYSCVDPNEAIGNLWGSKETVLNKHLDSLDIQYSKSGAGHTNKSKIDQLECELGKDNAAQCTYPLTKDVLEYLERGDNRFVLPTFTVFDADYNLDESSAAFQSAFRSIAVAAINRQQLKAEGIEESIKHDLSREFSKLTEIMKKSVPNLLNIDPQVVLQWEKLAKFDLALKFDNDEAAVPLSHKGTGFRRLLMVAYFEYAADSLNSINHIYAIEEPETYLHPRLQHNLLQSIQHLSTTNQFFITTHSSVFACASDKSSICIVQQKDGVSSTYTQPSNDQQLQELVINTLGLRPNMNLFNSGYSHIVFSEGAGDATFLNSYAKVFRHEWFKDVLVVPCGGEQIGYFIDRQLCKMLSRRFTVLIDSDRISASEYPNESKHKDYAEAVRNDNGRLHVLYRRCIENYYHPDAIDRVLVNKAKQPVNLCIGPFEKVKDIFKANATISSMNFKHKNNEEVFTEMTANEWDTVAIIPDGTNELKSLFKQIHDEVMLYNQ